MDDGRTSTTANARTVAPYTLILLAVATGSFCLRGASLQYEALRIVLVLMAAGEALAAFMLVFRARRMAEVAGRPYSAAYHGLVQDFGFYNLAMATLFVLCAVDPEGNRVALPVAIGLYALHGGTHLLRYFGLYYGGETSIPTRPPGHELRDALPLLVALAALLVLV
jgi:hypothetical protein